MKKLLSIFLSAVMSVSIITSAVPVGAEESVNQSENAYASSESNIRSTNSFGSLLTDALDEETEEQLKGNGYKVTSVEVDTSTNEAFVEFEALKNCTLVVAVFNEEGTQLVASGSKEVTNQELETTVTIEGTLPQYFYLKAFLVENTTMRPLSVEYDSPNYTQEMQEFFAKTTDDFELENVLNLDDDKTNNFAVYKDSVIKIPLVEGVNTVKSADDENGVYVIENADSNFTGLKKGDIFAYNYGENQLIIAKVDSIEVNGTTVTIDGAETSLDEIFDFVKIDEEAGLEEATYDDSKLGEGVTFEGFTEDSEAENEEQQNQERAIADYNEKGSVGLSFKLSGNYKIKKVGEVQLSGKVEAKFEVSLKVYITWSYQYFEFKKSDVNTFTGSLTIKDKTEDAEMFGEPLEKEFALGGVNIPIVACINVGVEPKFIVEASASVTWSQKITNTDGFSWDSDDGWSDLSSGPKGEGTLKIEGSLFVGIEAEVNVNIISPKVAKAGLKPRAGLEFKGTLTLIKTGDKSTSEKHECKLCVDGDVNAKARLNVELKFLDGAIKAEATIVEFTRKTGDFYYSFDYAEFGFGECPHKAYLVDVNVKDEAGKAVSGATVSVNTANIDSVDTDSKGNAKFYVPEGSYTVSADKDEYITDSQKINIAKTKKTVNLTLGSKDYKMTVLVKDQDGKAVSGAEVSAVMVKDKNGDKVTSGKEQILKTNSSGKAVFDVSSGTYSVSAIDKTKGAASKSVLINGKNAEIIMMLSSNIQNVTVKDEDGNLIQDVSLTVKTLTDENGTAVPNGDEIIVKTDEDGKAEFSVGNGKYRITAKKTGFKSKSQSITVQDNSNEIEFTLEKSSSGTLKDIVSVSAGVNHYAAIDKDGNLWMWGDNSYGQLGDGTTTSSDKPIKILENVAQVSLGYNYSGAVTEDGSLYMWGQNNEGQIGDGSKTNCLTPKKIMTGMKSVISNKCGWYSTNLHAYTMAITKDGTLLTWGDNTIGQLGDGTSIDRLTPTAVMNNVKHADICLQSMAITNDGSLYTWGNNAWGQLGNGQSGGDGTYNDGIDSNVPVKILDNVISSSMASWTGSAVTADGSLYLWGTSNGIQNSATPKVYTNGMKYVSINGGTSISEYGAAITTDGNLCLFGSGYKYDDVLSDVVDVSCGTNMGLAVTEDGTLYSWSRGSSTPEIFGADEEDTNTTNTNNTVSNQTRDVISEDDSTGADPAGNTSASGGQNNSTRAIESRAAASEKTAEFTDLIPGEVYNVYHVRTRILANPCGSGNLLYINQITADENGNISVTYTPKEEFITTEVFVVGATCSHEYDETGICTLCGEECSHEYDLSQGECTICHKEYDLRGDANMDGKVDVRDAAFIARKLAEQKTDEIPFLGDFNADIIINVRDAAAIARYLAKKS
ncbi:carboxypeptidase regulatory-like domain-containing protein [Porcipelethomonas sp.]|uniref:carboxypeptidase regulatory-like domain-containing protein n=1 Tax=Porcipelethomonas sp. TaxID=2981675 RepID=UPI003EF6D4CB